LNHRVSMSTSFLPFCLRLFDFNLLSILFFILLRDLVIAFSPYNSHESHQGSSHFMLNPY
jgi:hypothetical protein